MCNIYIYDKYLKNSPNKTKVKKIRALYKKNGAFDKPIVVKCKGSKYVLVDGYRCFFVAQQMGLKEIPAEMGTKEEIKLREKLRTKGTLVWDNCHSDVGEVIRHTISTVTIKYDDGRESTYDIYECLEDGHIRVL